MKNFQLHKKIKEYIEEEEKDSELLLNRLTLFIYGIESEQTDLHVLAKICGESKDPQDYLIRMIDYFNGELIRLPSKQNYRKCMLISVAFFFKEIQGYAWQDIYRILNLPEREKEQLSPISIGRKVKKIKKIISDSLYNLIEDIDESEIDKLLEKYNKNNKNP